MNARASGPAARSACVGLGLVGGAVLAATSCRQLLSVEERAACDRPSGPTDSCQQCMAAQCCEETMACQALPCADVDACVRACPSGDEACRADCRQKHPAAFGPGYAALASCQASHCTKECGLSCGGYAYRTPECGLCAATHGCCDEAAACAASEPCLALSFCARRCSTSEHQCFGECERAHPGGLALARAVGECLAADAECDHACYDGPNWTTCSGEPEPVGPSQVEVGVYVAYAVEGGPVVDAGLRACVRGPNDCDAAVEVTTDAAGFATLEVPEGFAGVLRVTGAGLDLDVLLGEPVDANETAYVLAFTTGAFVERFRHLVDQIDPIKGHLVVSVVDCDGAQPGGLSFSLGPGGEPFYGALGDDLADTTLTGDASAVFLNLDEGEHVFEATRAGDPETCLVRRNVRVAPGRITQATELVKGCWP